MSDLIDDFIAKKVVRRDLLDHECLICFEGTYRESLYTDTVRCDLCGDMPPRWLTKGEMFRHVHFQEGKHS